MDQPTCCERAKWVSVLDLGQAGGFEFILADASTAGRTKSIASGPELKGFMRAWGDTHL